MVLELSMVSGNRSSKAENVPVTSEVPQTVRRPVCRRDFVSRCKRREPIGAPPRRIPAMSADVGFTARCKSYVCCIVAAPRMHGNHFRGGTHELVVFRNGIIPAPCVSK
jgi:hypothetical protein